MPVWDRARQGHLSVLGDSGGSDGAGDIAVQSESRARCSGGSEGPGVGGSLAGVLWPVRGRAAPRAPAPQNCSLIDGSVAQGPGQ